MVGLQPSNERVSSAPDNILIYMPAIEREAKSIMLEQGARPGFFAFFHRAKGNSPEAQAVIALLFLIGWVDDQMLLDEAIFWSNRSAQAGNAFGQWVNAWTHLESFEMREGIDRLVLSAEQGFPPSIYTLGAFSYNGVVLEHSPKMGMQLINAAAQMGNQTAKTVLATLYRRGQGGVANMLYGLFVFPLLLKSSNLLYRFKQEKFELNRLVYARSIVLENMIRRRTRGEQIDPKYEERLANLIPSSHRIHN